MLSEENTMSYGIPICMYTYTCTQKERNVICQYIATKNVYSRKCLPKFKHFTIITIQAGLAV